MNSATANLDEPSTGLGAQANPYPGLRPFREDEEYLFFGRENQVDAMVDKLALNRFLAVVGTSGSGKSSLVNCGLRPALHGGSMARAGTAWRMAQFRPGSDPMKAMASALAQDGVLFRNYRAAGLTLTEIVETTLRMSKLGLIDIYEQAHLGADVNLLVVVDQFEELFRYRQLAVGLQKNLYGVSETAAAFVNLLLEAGAQTTYPIYVVLTMRSDFLGDCAHFPGLAEAINTGQYLVPRLTRDERRAAINGPAVVGGAQIAPVLLTRLVNDVGDNPDQLSILQHALNRTWARWQNEGGCSGPLNLEHYESIGAMGHALDQHAEKAYAELDGVRQQRICQKLFKALTDRVTDPRGVRRPTTLGTLCALADATEAEVTQVIDVFRRPSRSFLMPPAGERLDAKTVIDISHESLMRVWRRLAVWADEEAQSARRFQRLVEVGRLHAEGKAALWRDPDLQLALAWRAAETPNETLADSYGGGFEEAMSFLDKSKQARDEEIAENVLTQRWRKPRAVIAVLVLGLYFRFGVGFGNDFWGTIYDAMLEIAPFKFTSLLGNLFELTAHFALFALLTHFGERIYRFLWMDSIRRDVANEVLSSPEIQEAEQRYAPTWRRILAAIIDLLIWFTAFMATGITLFVLLEFEESDLKTLAVLFVPYFFYDVLMTRSSRKGTLGKMALGLTVTDMQGDRVSLLRATIRHILRFLCVGYLILPFTAKKQALHDMVAGCIVNYRPRKARRRV